MNKENSIYSTLICFKNNCIKELWLTKGNTYIFKDIFLFPYLQILFWAILLLQASIVASHWAVSHWLSCSGAGGGPAFLPLSGWSVAPSCRGQQCAMCDSCSLKEVSVCWVSHFQGRYMWPGKLRRVHSFFTYPVRMAPGQSIPATSESHLNHMNLTSTLF